MRRVLGRTKASLLRAVFAELERAGGRWCVVGDTSMLPDNAEHDVDLILEPSLLPEFPALVRDFADRHGVAVVQDLQHEVDARFFVLAWIDASGPAFLYLDACADWRRGGRLLLRADELLRERVAMPYDDGAGRFYRPDPATNFAYYLLKRLDKGALDEVNAAALARDFAADPQGARAFLARRMPTSASLIAEAAASGRWQSVQAALPMLRGEVRAHALSRPPALSELARRALRFVRPGGLLLHLATRIDDATRQAAGRMRQAWAPAFRRIAHLERSRALGLIGFTSAVRPLLVRTSLVTLTAPALATHLTRHPDVVDLTDVAADAHAADARLLTAMSRRHAARHDFGYLRWGW